MRPSWASLLVSSELVGALVGGARVLVGEASGQPDARDGRSKPPQLCPLPDCVGGAWVGGGANCLGCWQALGEPWPWLRAEKSARSPARTVRWCCPRRLAANIYNFL